MSEFTTKQLIEHLREDSCQTCQAAADLLARIPDPDDLPEELVDQVRRLIQKPTRNWQQGAEAAIRATIAYITKGTT